MMSSFHTTFHHLESFSDGPVLQMGQPASALSERQHTDNLAPYRNDSHGLERELQFADLEYVEPQAMG